jgi:hypothetical protein
MALLLYFAHFLFCRYDTFPNTAQKVRSVGAVVASMNTFSKYLIMANLHTTPAQELNLPARIIMYRLVLNCP